MSTSSLRRIEANRRNAQKSTGPRTPEGKAKVRFNALKHGLSAKHLVFAGPEDEADFRSLHVAFRTHFLPRTRTEVELVDQFTVTSWRLQRARRLETDFLKSHSDQLFDPEGRNMRTLDTISLHEARLDRRFHRLLNDIRRWKALEAKPVEPTADSHSLQLLTPSEASPSPAFS